MRQAHSKLAKGLLEEILLPENWNTKPCIFFLFQALRRA